MCQLIGVAARPAPDPTLLVPLVFSAKSLFKAFFCEEAYDCGCTCDEVGHVNCLVAEGICTHDAAQLCEEACLCKEV